MIVISFMDNFSLFTIKMLVAVSIITLGVCLLLYHTAVMDHNNLTFKTVTNMNILKYHRVRDEFHNAYDSY